MISKLFKTIYKILTSRFKKDDGDLVEEKRKICLKCPYNTKNIEKYSLKVKILKTLSDFYSLITGRKNVDNLGNCTACDICSIYFKTIDEEVCPHPNGDQWKNINKNNEKNR